MLGVYVFVRAIHEISTESGRIVIFIWRNDVKSGDHGKEK